MLCFSEPFMLIGRMDMFADFLWVPERILDYMWTRGNPRYYQCMLDEDMIRRVTSATPIVFFGWDSLFRFCLGPYLFLRLRWTVPLRSKQFARDFTLWFSVIEAFSTTAYSCACVGADLCNRCKKRKLRRWKRTPTFGCMRIWKSGCTFFFCHQNVPRKKNMWGIGSGLRLLGFFYVFFPT